MLDKNINQYIDRQLSKYDNDLLLEMEKYGKDRNFPLVGRQVGVFLSFLAKIIQPKLIFELGSGFGYSAYWFLQGLPSNGKIVLTDFSEENSQKAKSFLKSDFETHRLKYHIGNALEALNEETRSIDIIYNDIDKGAYPEAFEVVTRKLKVGGLYIVDNVLWRGRVALTNPPQDRHPGWTEAIRTHNQMIADHPDFEHFYNPSRDGVLVARRVRIS